MTNKLSAILLFVFLRIASGYAASIEQPDSSPQDANLLQTIASDANRGYPNAQFKLGEMYSKGNGVQQDCNEAFKWFAKAAEKGHTEAQFRVGEMYAKGDGVPQDCNEACKRFTKIAIKGHAGAQYKLGEMYSGGNGISQDYSEAFKWFEKAAKKGYATAQARLALIYYEGKGVIEDYIEAYKWALLAGMNGEDVSENKQLIAAKMTPAQIADAQKRAKEFVANKNNDNPTEPNLSQDETKDALRVERSQDKIQKMRDEIELTETQIENLPPLEPINRRPLEEVLTVPEKKHALLNKEKNNYENIIRIVEKYSDLGINVMNMKKLLVECECRIDEVKLKEEYLRK